MTEALRLRLQAESAMWRQRGYTHLRLLLEDAIAALAQPPAPTAQPTTDDRLRMSLRADLATESLAVDDLLRAMGEDPEQYRTDGGAVNRPRLLAWLKDRDAQPVQQPGAEPADVLLQAIQHLNQNPYNLTKRECIDVLQSLRAEFSDAKAAPAQRQPLSDMAEHLLDGFGSRIATAEMNGDSYDAGYLKAMQKEFIEFAAAFGIHPENDAAQKGEKL
jgi:hypothetical protein